MGGAILAHMSHGEPYVTRPVLLVLIWMAGFLRRPRLLIDPKTTPVAPSRTAWRRLGPAGFDIGRDAPPSKNARAYMSSPEWIDLGDEVVRSCGGVASCMAYGGD